MMAIRLTFITYGTLKIKEVKILPDKDAFYRNYNAYLQEEKGSSDKAACREIREAIVTGLIAKYNNGEEKLITNMGSVLKLETRAYIIIKLLEETVISKLGDFQILYNTILERRKKADYSDEWKMLDLARIAMIEQIKPEDNFMENKLTFILKVEPWNDALKAVIQKIAELQIRKIKPEESFMDKKMSLLLKEEGESWRKVLTSITQKIDNNNTKTNDLLKIEWIRIINIVESFEYLPELKPELKTLMVSLLDLADKIGPGIEEYRKRGIRIQDKNGTS